MQSLRSSVHGVAEAIFEPRLLRRPVVGGAPRNNRAFTLIEIIIVIVVLSLALGTLLTVFGSIVSNFIVPYTTQVAGGLAEQEMERVTGLRYSQVVNEGPPTFPSPLDDYSFQVVVSAVPANIFNDPLLARYKQVAITVSNALVGSVQLTTIVTNN